MEAQLDFLHDHIQEKVDRVNSINEDENLKELIDKSKIETNAERNQRFGKKENENGKKSTKSLVVKNMLKKKW